MTDGDKETIIIYAKKLEKPCYLLEYLADNESYYSKFLPAEVAKNITTNLKK